MLKQALNTASVSFRDVKCVKTTGVRRVLNYLPPSWNITIARDSCCVIHFTVRDIVPVHNTYSYIKLAFCTI